MKRFFDAELESFRAHLLQMGERAIDQTRQAMRALTEGDIPQADKVIAADDELDRLRNIVERRAKRPRATPTDGTPSAVSPTPDQAGEP